MLVIWECGSVFESMVIVGFREREMARKKIREYDSKRLLKEHYKRLTGTELGIKSAQVSSISLTLILIALQICFMNPNVGPFCSHLNVVVLDYQL